MTTVIKGGMVIDPSQNVHDCLNVIIENGKISSITDKMPAAADIRIIDAPGRVVCPGFVDIHMHEDSLDSDDSNSSLACLLRMGVTTGVAGNCGENKEDPVEYLKTVKERGCYINIAMLAGHGYFREKYSTADRYSAVSSEELGIIKSAIQHSLDAGCIGVSFGLEYIPGVTEEEIAECSRLAKGKLITAHIRSCGIHAKAAVRELADICLTEGLNLEISHIGSMAGYGMIGESLDLIKGYRAKGANISCDCYPYLSYCTSIGSAVYDEGWRGLMFCDYGDIEMCEGMYKGQRCTKEIFEQERKSHPDYYTIGHVMKQDDVDMAYLQKFVMVASDGIFNNHEGHPRAAGAFPKFFCDYVKTGKISMDEAIHKCTYMPSEKAGLRHKGTLKPGADADIVIFNPETIKDNSTYADSKCAPSGLDYVFIAGKTAVKNGKIINRNLGTAIYI